MLVGCDRSYNPVRSFGGGFAPCVSGGTVVDDFDFDVEDIEEYSAAFGVGPSEEAVNVWADRVEEEWQLMRLHRVFVG